ncbi:MULTISPECIES: bifunctional (p)ppGpp synthetase/guanosine-3',5'-bis(diphosphate) 3'-pyrophosphohydrolase [Microbacterium]|uniref:RelA/SpoT family protein n=1 Tax=Microbacterium TaxID=33882 RepID=UPI0027D7BE55|nr:MULTISPECIES: bifunctional (p)ppGpp synthetase/guanosine-3',5'-bis(diphosphate) 3'-pyrophosphohydrolase [Microbacterium]
MLSDPQAGLRRLVPRIFSRSARRDDVEQLLRTVHTHHRKGDLSIVARAYDVADGAHTGQVRQSGEPYISHPLAVAQILAELGIGPKIIAAALLHRTVEDTDYQLNELTADFGDEVAILVDGVAKLDKVKYGDSVNAETVQKMIVAMSRDIGVLLIKLANRLHNARTWGFIAPEKARKMATETLEVYAPLAHRLGIQAIRSELEDLSFAVMHPTLYAEIESLVSQRCPDRERYVQNVIDAVDADLRELRVRGRVVGRAKPLYSIYQKMVVRGREFDDIYDLIGIRILVGTVRDCYAVLGAIHARWTPLPGRFKDYIATPKISLYQSLHTTVIGPGGRTVEIQIRTHEMHQQAESGAPAYWKRKDQAAGGKPGTESVDADMAWIAHISDWQAETADPGEFLDSLRFEIGAKEVYVFTPKGRVVGLPTGATPVDFAYAVHTEIGHRTMGAKVNGRLVPLESTLQSGDVVEVFTSKDPDAGPSQDWLGFVETRRARNKIREWFTKERREEAIEQGKDSIARAMRRRNLPLRLMSQGSFTEVARLFRYENVSALYAAVGEGHVSTQLVIEKVAALVSAEETSTGPIDLPQVGRSRAPRGGDSGVLVRGAPDILIKLAKCCMPVPGDEIVGFVTRGSRVSVHRADCTNPPSLRTNSERLVEVAWAPTTESVFLVRIRVEALDRTGLLRDVTDVLRAHHVNMLSATVSVTTDRLTLSRFMFEIGDTVHLDRVLNAARRIEGVYDVYRDTST